MSRLCGWDRLRSFGLLRMPQDDNTPGMRSGAAIARCMSDLGRELVAAVILR